MYHYLFDMRDTARKLIRENPNIDFGLYVGERRSFVLADLRNEAGLYDELCDYAWFNGMSNQEAKACVLDNLDLLIEACSTMKRAMIRKHVENGDWIWFDLLIRRHVADEAIEMALDDLEFEGFATWERDEDVDVERSEDNE